MPCVIYFCFIHLINFSFLDCTILAPVTYMKVYSNIIRPKHSYKTFGSVKNFVIFLQGVLLKVILVQTATGQSLHDSSTVVHRMAFKLLVLFIQVHDTTYNRNLILVVNTVSATNLTFPLSISYYKCVLSNAHYYERFLKLSNNSAYNSNPLMNASPIIASRILGGFQIICALYIYK
jgi:hypothetical protein